MPSLYLDSSAILSYPDWRPAAPMRTRLVVGGVIASSGEVVVGRSSGVAETPQRRQIHQRKRRRFRLHNCFADDAHAAKRIVDARLEAMSCGGLHTSQQRYL